MASMVASGAACSSDPTPTASGSLVSMPRDTRDAGQPSACPQPGDSMIAKGKEIFRFETFGDEAFWTGALKLPSAIAGSPGGASNGSAGAGVSPKTALAVGLKVDAEALPASLVDQIRAGQVDLDSPATTVALIGLDAVVGIKGVVNPKDSSLQSIGITCALCHSTVDDSFAPGIGKRLDGWPNRDLNAGAVIALSPDLSPIATLLGVDEATVRTVLAAWGPGKFDAELILDGKGFRPDGKTAATLLPPAYGLAGVNLHTYTGWGSVPYWNAFVAVLEMHGSGNFFDPRLDDANRFPVAARAKMGHTQTTNDLVTDKLAPLHFYQLSLPPPTPPDGTLDAAAATRGEAVFMGAGKCAQCHVPPLYTEPGWNLHPASDIGIDDFQAQRAPDGKYRTTPLRGLVSHAKGGYYHDGRFATLRDVVDHYDGFLALSLTESQKNDLVEFLKSL